MALVDLKSLIYDSELNKYALGGFNITNLEMVEGVLEAAQELMVPVIFNVHPDQIGHTSIEVIVSLVKQASEKVKIPVVLHIDYVKALMLLRKAIYCGFNSLMFVTPEEYSFEKSVRETRIAAELAHQFGLLIESELKPEQDTGLTDPDMAEIFVKETGIDIFSPFIGTAHWGGKADLRLDLLKDIKQKTKCYISLHGGSGVQDTVLQKAIRLGINKASVYSQLSKSAVLKLTDRFKIAEEPDIVEIYGIMKNAVKETAIRRLAVLSMK